MDITETAKLLTFYAGLTGKEVNAAMAHTWSVVLEDIPYEIGYAALVQLVRSADGVYGITPAAIHKHAEPLLRRLARDVRSAKLRNWLPADWPETQPLPDVVRQRFKREFEATNDYPAIEADDDAQTALGAGA